MSQTDPPSPPNQPPVSHRAAAAAGAAGQQIQLRAEDVVSFFHQLYYRIGHERGGTWQQTFWMGVRTEKLPLDMWIYQEILHHVRPDFILETGTRHGGSALFFCQMMDLMGARVRRGDGGHHAAAQAAGACAADVSHRVING
jgi:cephalosporin hydroxylase